MPLIEIVIATLGDPLLIGDRNSRQQKLCNLGGVQALIHLATGFPLANNSVDLVALLGLGYMPIDHSNRF